MLGISVINFLYNMFSECKWTRPENLNGMLLKLNLLITVFIYIIILLEMSNFNFFEMIKTVDCLNINIQNNQCVLIIYFQISGVKVHSQTNFSFLFVSTSSVSHIKDCPTWVPRCRSVRFIDNIDVKNFWDYIFKCKIKIDHVIQ